MPGKDPVYSIEESSLLLDRHNNGLESRLLGLGRGKLRSYAGKIRLQQIALIRHQLSLFLGRIRGRRLKSIDRSIQ